MRKTRRFSRSTSVPCCGVFFLISGAPGAGKTSCLKRLRQALPNISWHDHDEIGVPPDADLVWRQRTLERWVQEALKRQDRGRSMGLTSNAPFGELLATPSFPRLSGARGIVIDVADQERVRRLRSRGAAGLACQDTLCWAAWHRMHGIDPTWEPSVIRRGAWSGMRWDRVEGLTNADARWDVTVLPTTGQPFAWVAVQLSAWVGGMPLG